VLHHEGAHRHLVRLEDLPLLDLGDEYLGRPAVVHVRATDVDVPGEIVQQEVHLAPRARGPVHLEGRVLARDPARDEEMAQVDDVVRVVMRDEHRRPVIGAHARLDELDAHARARVHQEALLAQRQERGGPAALRVGRGRAGAEQHGAHGRYLAPAGARRRACGSNR
jgi:hypothetical protein